MAVPPHSFFGFDLKYENHLDRHKHLDSMSLMGEISVNCATGHGVFDTLFICLHYAYAAPTPGARHPRLHDYMHP